MTEVILQKKDIFLNSNLFLKALVKAGCLKDVLLDVVGQQ